MTLPRSSNLLNLHPEFLNLNFHVAMEETNIFLTLFTGAEWSEEAIALLLSFKGFILQAQIAGYTSYGTPEVYLFACLSANVSVSVQ